MAKNLTKIQKQNLTALLDKFALDNYDKGFDIWYETLDKPDKEEVFSKCRTPKGMLNTFINWNWDQGIMYSAIGSEQCAMYEVDKQGYDKYQANAKQSKTGLMKALIKFVKTRTDYPFG